MKSRLFKMCAWTLVLVLLANMIPAQVLGAGTQAAETKEVVVSENQNDGVAVSNTIVDSNPNIPANENASILAEIVEHRTEFSKEYILSNGTNMAVVYPEPVHFQKDGRWEDIDNTLKAVGSGDSAVYTNTADAWQVMLPQKLGKDARISISKDGYTVSFRMTGELKTNAQSKAVAISLSGIHKDMSVWVTEARDTNGQAQMFDYSDEKTKSKHPETIRDKLKSRVTYSNVYQNTDIVYDLNSHQLKESILIKEYDASIYGYRYVLETGTLNPVLNDDGSIDLCAPNTNEVVMTMPAPYMIDDAGIVCSDVGVTLEQSNGTYTLTYTLPMQWLADATRAWPVILDPIVSKSGHYSSVQDKTVMEQVSTSSTASLNQCGWRTGNGIMQCYVMFNTLPELSSADIIVDASVAMYKPVTSYDPTIVEVRKVANSWTSETLTWSNKPNVGGIIEDFAIVQNEGYCYWNITDIARGWYETGINSGMVFKAPDSVESAAVTSFTQFKSSDYDKYHPEYGPTLYVVFRNSNGLENYWDYTSAAAGRAGTGYVNNYTGNLTWTHSDIGFGGNRMPVSIYHIYNANDYGNNSFGLGYGWRTNYNQAIGLWSSSTNAGDLQETVQQYYYWQDGDGTKHFFVPNNEGVLVDEDGLNLTLTVGTNSYTITDQYGNTSVFEKFTNSSDTTIVGRLVSLSDNQKEKSTISITYANPAGMLISKIIDGANREYNFTYSNDLLSRISYTGTGTREVAYVSFSYGNAQLTTITNQDGKVSQYAYSLFCANTANSANEKPLLHTVTDVDGYRIQYTYCAAAPHRIIAIAEYDGAVAGSSLSIEYAHNQTTLTDHNGNTQIMQFNDWGNVVTIQDGEGRAQFAQYALNGYDEETADVTAKGNQLRQSSKLQNTVGNLLYEIGFEHANFWRTNTTDLFISQTTEDAYLGNCSLKAVTGTENTYYGAFSQGFYIAPGETVTLSAYVKNPDAPATIALHHNDGVNFYTYHGETLAPSNEWVRTEITYTNDFPYTVAACAYLFASYPGTYYIDCVQVEKEAAASRLNLVDNGDFRNGFYGWVDNSGSLVTLDASAAPELDNNVHKIIGSPNAQKHLSQTVNVSGNAGDTFVVSGWAKGDSAPLTGDRQFAITGTFNYTDGTTKEFIAQFNPDTDSTMSWQYSAEVMVAEKAYSSITIQIVYNNNVNNVYFDGIQLFKETFGSSYTYNEEGNVISVKDLQNQTTTYEYDTNNNLTKILQNNQAKMTYTYDSYHNVKTATTAEGVVYEFTYDDWGNNTAVSIVSGGTKITSTATYSADGNILVSTKDALDKTTQYGYNINTNVLEWVEYPEDDENTRTEYGYDSMYRLASATMDVDGSYNLNAAYTYTDDLLTKITTNSVVYNFSHGSFGTVNNIKVGNRMLASYSYTGDGNRYLIRLAYGNDDFISYTYDDYGRVLSQTYEDGSTVTYQYDNTGALATVTDSASGIKTTYYYDLIDRLMKYVETAYGYSHSVSYTYDVENNLTGQTENINGRKLISTHTFDSDNRLDQTVVNDSSLSGNIVTQYEYDAYGRIYDISTEYGSYYGVTKNFFFGSAGSGTTSNRVVNYQADTPNFVVNYDIAYDNNGNITSVEVGAGELTYVYDSANQLIRENNSFANKTWVWTYDDAGNIVSKKEYSYTAGILGTVLDTITYTYGDTNWGDLLTAYDGTAITYDGIGNPLSDGTWTYTWRNGRELATMTSGSTTWNYTYDANGMRTKRTNGSTTYTYVYNGGQLSQMTCGSNTLLFTYDATGAPVAVTYNGTVYYYVTTLQGDVQMIIDLDGEEVVSYVYDAWGRLISTTGSMASTLGIYNPLRYRGYVYDRETGLYYLQSRYYNPTIGRFINADAFTSTGQGLLGNNMFAYCLNNPVVRIDPTGSISYTQIEDPNDNNNPLDDVARIGTGSISKGTFRAKLAKLTGVAPTNSDAHHIFPRKFTAEFSSLGINNQDPIYGSWVNSAKHAKFSYAYNQWWTAFFGMNNVTASDAFALVDFLSVLFGFDLNY